MDILHCRQKANAKTDGLRKKGREGLKRTELAQQTNQWPILANTVRQECINPSRQVARAIEFCLVLPDICGCSVWDLQSVSTVAHFVDICSTEPYT